MKVTINLEKRYAYFIIGLLILSAGIFAVNALTPGETPNPGHNIQSIGPPSGCADGQVLQFINETVGWGCVEKIDWSESIPQLNVEEICLNGDCINSWSEAGIGGCPSGFVDTGYNYCIQIDENSGRNWADAISYCGVLDARLCSKMEWSEACKLELGLNDMFDGGEWEWISNSCGTSGYHNCVGFTSCDTASCSKPSNIFPFRCCYTKE